jgi:hypothetical protein
MSTLKVNTVQHNTSGFNNVVQFTDGAGTENGTLCRAWVNFNGTGTVAIRASFNVSSITDNGTGDYTVNFSNAMSNNDYAAAGTLSNTANDWGIKYAGAIRGVNGWDQAGDVEPTTTTFRLNSYYGSTGSSNGAQDDFSQITAVFYN